MWVSVSFPSVANSNGGPNVFHRLSFVADWQQPRKRHHDATQVIRNAISYI